MIPGLDPGFRIGRDPPIFVMFRIGTGWATFHRLALSVLYRR
jgi:hypothetical protein